MESNENKWRKNFDILLDVSKAMSAERNHYRLWQLIVRKTTEALDAERSSLFLLDRETNELFSQFAEKSEIKEIRLPMGQGIVGYVAQSREVVHIPDAYQDERFNQEIDRKTGYITRNILCVPLINHKDEVMGSIQVLNKKNGAFTEEDIELLKAFSSQAAVSLDNSSLIQHYIEKEKMAAAMKIAQDIQKSLLPSTEIKTPEVELYGWNKSCDEIGGDYYDYLMISENKVGIIVGDVSGHGVGSALLMATVRAFLRGLLVLEQTPKETMTRLNALVMNDLQKDGMFVTMFFGVLDLQKKILTYSSAGHDPPLIIRSQSNQADELASTGIPLGILPDFEYEEATIEDLQLGDLIAITTDGIWESPNASGERFGWERVTHSILENRNKSLNDVVDRVVQDLHDFVQEATPDDDLTMLMVKVKG